MDHYHVLLIHDNGKASTETIDAELLVKWLDEEFQNKWGFQVLHVMYRGVIT